MHESGAAIRTDGLTKRFGRKTAVDGLTLSIAAGTVFGLLGRNGAGKSSTIRMLTTLSPVTAGSANVAGFNVAKEPVDVRRHIGYVPQLQSSDVDLTGYENLLIFAKLYRVPVDRRRERIDDALELMGLKESRDVLVRHYSGGMVRRLEIAQAVLHRPAVLFMDEPTVGLDPLARHAVWRRIRELRSKLGTTILLTTHYMDEAMELCGTVAFLHDGKLAALGAPKELCTAAGPDADLDDVFIAFTRSQR